ncbi:hypothetical protein GLYMA_01G203100v4 [Glycine max]|nr:hypothetical protein GLYMA_01G203100v4 [Glycine max]KAH1164041.1 hypothetical protein GYH30_002201 [Glycine max]
MAESFELPNRLAILPFRNKVLLPGAIIRIRCTSPISVKLVEQELWQREEKGLIGILPVRDAAAEIQPAGPVISHGKGTDSLDQNSKVQGGSSDSQKLDVKNQHDVVHWHNRGVAARALHLSRGVEKPSGRVTYIVVLEGLCRFSVQELSTRGTYHTARISSLEMTKTEMEQVEQDPDFITLSRQFKATAMELISVLEQKQKTGGRTKVLLETVPVHKLADIFVASFEISFEEQLSMLDSVDPKVRLSKATELVDRHLQSILVAEKITQKVEGQLSKSQKEFLLRQQRVAVCNPVMLIDEIDKTGSDVRGDPASALLEVLDPEQNKAFNDHYLNVPFDLSKVIFVATANRAQPIPPPLLDRMEVIELPGYTAEEKLKIAMQHLIPRVLEQHGLSSEFLQIPEGMVQLVIQRYTREAGVRNLERNLAALARAAAVRVAEQEQVVPLNKGVEGLSTPLLENRLSDGAEVEMEVIPMGVNNRDISNTFRITSPLVVDEAMLEKVLGPPKFDGREAEDRVATPGASVGLVWTTFGGEVQFVEATAMVGKGELHLTGQLGDVIKESAQIALTWVRARATELRLAAAEGINLLEGRDIHIHFPAGAVPKDGPSAGVTLVTALVSLFSQRRVRSDTAMTGEMTLRGLVLPVGGIKDKILAAHRCGIKRVILPERNLKDLVEVPSSVLADLEILLAKRMEDVLEQAFDGGCPWRQHSKL